VPPSGKNRQLVALVCMRVAEQFWERGALAPFSEVAVVSRLVLRMALLSASGLSLSGLVDSLRVVQSGLEALPVVLEQVVLVPLALEPVLPQVEAAV
jgi:hypothetical protein